jgi:hypothetical protein
VYQNVSMRMLERFGESVIGPWVALIFSTFYYTYHRYTYYRGIIFVSVVNLFPLAAKFTNFLFVLVFIQPMQFVYLPNYHHQC